MSIDAFRKGMEKPGCRWIVTAVSLLMGMGFLVGGVKCNQLMNQSQANLEQGMDNGAKIGSIGDFPVYDGPLQKAAPDPATATPKDIANSYAQGLDAQVTHGLLLQLAKQKKISLVDDAVLKAASDQFDESIPMEKMMIAQQGKIPQNATDQQFADYIKKLTGKSLDELKQAQMDQMKQKLNDPNQREQALGDMANDLVDKGIQNSLTVTDADLQHSRDAMVMKRVLLQTQKHPGKDIKQMAEGILADIKAKKITFEQAMDKYTDEPAAKGKSPHDNTIEIDMQTLMVNADYQPLKGMKPGDISDVLPVAPDGYAIYKYEKYKANPIPDFDKQKADIRKNYLSTIAASQLQDGLKALRKQNLIHWEDPGWGILNDWYQGTVMDNTFQEKSTTEQNRILKDFLDKATSSKSNDPRGSLLTAAAIMDKMWTAAKPAEKKTLEDQYMKVLEQFVSSYGSYAAEVQLAQFAADKKDGSLADKSLENAVAINASNVTTSDGSKNFSDLAGMAEDYQSKGILTSKQADSIFEKLASFRKERLAFDKQTAEDRKQEEIQRKKAEEDRKRIAAENAKKNPPPEKIPGPVKPSFPAPKPAPSVPNLNPGLSTTGAVPPPH